MIYLWQREQGTKLTLDDGWKEYRVAVQHGVDAKLTNRKCPDFPVLEGKHSVLAV